MDRAEIAVQLKTFLETEFPKPGVELTDSTNLLEDWFIDSLNIVETVLFIEQSFGANLARADINGANFKDIAALSGLIAERLPG